MTTIKTITSYSIHWGNPYTKPPLGAPKTLIWEFLEPNSDRVDLINQLLKKARELYPDLKAYLSLGGGYGISVNFHNIKPPTVLKPQTILKMRKQRTLKKLKKQISLFLDDEYQKVLTENKKYFDIDMITKTQQKRLSIKTELCQESANFNNQKNQLRYL